MSDPILRVSGLRCSIAGQQVVEDVSFEVPPVGITAVLGRNGAGKTSTLRGIMGLSARRGEIVLAGQRIDALPTHRVVQRGVGYVPEDREVFGTLSVAENLALAERQAQPRREFVAELFPDLVKRKDQAAGSLSGGQQQMVSLARALLNDNRILLVDEPTKGLAPQIVDDVADALAEASKTVPVLLVEQNLDVVRRLAAGAVVISSGRVVHTGDAAEILDDEALTQRLLGVHASGEAA
ncbi:ABC transporter ATP-binding protein [Brevibacterium yomogidense]|uniref:Branched-chain amino acid transport ATP-binding protein LivF (TC 3.A.1.4.1) n=1 Tax=Brevibacterium yomogidense TaxID=946573 RepID=A0A1X6X7D2_9MICO|nr:ABC transporter ATP-binding protein [Brevibacterium yomogidense]SLM95066.1 Branched-chain amino acid transport ATP-binding protein LivF (TC 3.A.1.4.1) [Brevibacterium yomogidense]